MTSGLWGPTGLEEEDVKMGQGDGDGGYPRIYQGEELGWDRGASLNTACYVITAHPELPWSQQPPDRHHQTPARHFQTIGMHPGALLSTTTRCKLSSPQHRRALGTAPLSLLRCYGPAPGWARGLLPPPAIGCSPGLRGCVDVGVGMDGDGGTDGGAAPGADVAVDPNTDGRCHC